MRAARASLLVPVLAWASTSFAEEPHDGLFPEPDSSRLEDIDDYQDPETRTAHFALGWLDAVMDPWQDLKNQLRDDYGLDFFVAYSPQVQLGAWSGKNSFLGDQWDLLGEWRILEHESFGSGRLQFWLFRTLTWGSHRGAQFQEGAGSGWELNDLDTGGSNDRNAIGFLWWEQLLFDEHVRVILGKLDPPTLIATNRYLWDDRTDFNAGPLSNDVVVTLNEEQALGAFLELHHAGLYVSGLWIDAAANNNSIDVKSVDNGDYAWAGEVGYETHIDGLGEGNYRASWFHSESTGKGKSESSGTGGAFSIDQDLGENAAVFAYFSRRTGRRRALKQNFSAGVVFRKPLGFEHDRIGLAFSWGKPDGMGDDGTKDDQYGLELYWRLQLLDRLEVTPILQYIIKPADSSRDGRFAGGLRLRFYL